MNTQQEAPTSGEASLTPSLQDQHRGRGSTSSLNSSNVESATEISNTPLQFEHIKHQKEIWETGIEMCV